MSPTYEHPSLRMYVTPEQRERAESWLKEAYADGRITELEFDTRIGQVITAETRKDLNEAFYGLVQVPTPSRVLGVHPAYQPQVFQGGQVAAYGLGGDRELSGQVAHRHPAATGDEVDDGLLALLGVQAGLPRDDRVAESVFMLF